MEAPASQLIELRTPDERPYFLSVKPAQDVYHEAAAQSGLFDHVPRLLWGLISPGDVFFDLGANIGTVSIPLAIKGASVHAFEMLPENVEHLSAASKASSAPIAIHEVAIWSDDTELSVGGQSAWAQVVGESNRKVRAISLDGFVRNQKIDRVNVIKMDIEGSELPALEGMKNILKNQSPDIVLESNVYCNNGKYSIQELFFLLSKFKYKIYRIEDGLLHPFHTNDCQEVVFSDYLATRKDERDISAATGFVVRPMTREELVQSILRQDWYPEVHKVYTYTALAALAADYFGRSVLDDSRVLDMAEKWRPLMTHSHKLAADLRIGARPISLWRMQWERARIWLDDRGLLF